MSNIPNFFKVSESVATGAQPPVEGLQELKEAGYTAVLNLSPRSTPNYLPQEAEIVESQGMDYVHYPVDCSHLKKNHYTMFSKIMQGFSDARVFIHCGGNIKSSNLMHMYNVLESDMDEKDSYNELLKVQTPEEKWIRYFRDFGMKGLPA
ncbi:MAG: protein tyrosine phosphatase family protein [Spirochaetales bacterium]|nr:protein tyrosine phosphatase family protein [Spirochaetales bacterium]